MGYSATKNDEKIPATIASQVTRTPGRMQARNKLIVAIRDEESVGTEWLSRVRAAVKRSESGRMPMRTGW